MSGRNQEPQYRYRLSYPKRGRLRYLGHLELIATIDRTVRRAKLPFAITNGFSPRMKAQFTAALPVGCSSVVEYFDVWLTQELTPAEVLARYTQAAAPDMAPYSCVQLEGKPPALEASLTRSSWVVRIALIGTKTVEEQSQALIGAVEELKAEGILHYMRGDKPKQIDLGDTLLHYSFEPAPNEPNPRYGLVCRMETRSSNVGALRPQLLLAEACRRAGLELAEPLRVVRVGQWAQEDGYLVDAQSGERILDLYR